MNLILIYGPPAAGKFTVAQELCKQTGYKLFHNHLTVDLVTSIFPFGSPGFSTMNNLFRILMLKEAAKQKVKGVVLTYVYLKGKDDAFVRKLVRAVQSHKGKVKFVRLGCDMTALLARVESDSRKKFGKLQSKHHLEKVLSEKDLVSSISFVKSLEIDNTNVSAKKVAAQIKKHYRL